MAKYVSDQDIRCPAAQGKMLNLCKGERGCPRPHYQLPNQLLNMPRRQMIEIIHRSRYNKPADEIIPNNP